MTTFHFPIGDCSGDGHSITQICYIACDDPHMTTDIIEAIYQTALKGIPDKMRPDKLFRNYEDNRIPKKEYEELKALIKDFPEADLWNDELTGNTDWFVEYIVCLLNHFGASKFYSTHCSETELNFGNIAYGLFYC